MRITKFLGSHCFRFSTIFFAAGLQCYAYAGFAVNTNPGEPSSIYESPTTLVTKCVSKEQVLEFYKKNQDKKYNIIFAYILNIGNVQGLKLDAAAPTNSFCINPYTHKIGVAENPKEALALTQARPQVFYAVAGETLSATVMRWAKEQGYQAKWLSPNDFNIEVTYAFQQPFPEALDQLLQSIAASSDGFAVNATIMKNGIVLVKENEYQAKPVIG